MARARHAKPSRLLAWLFPGRAARRRRALLQDSLLRQLAEQLRSVRAVADAYAAAAAAAQSRADAADAALRDVRLEVARLREELLWAWADGRVPTGAVAREATVLDLRRA